jgi:hypothetical protein
MKNIEIPSIPNKKEYSNRSMKYTNWKEASNGSNKIQIKLNIKKIINEISK